MRQRTTVRAELRYLVSLGLVVVAIGGPLYVAVSIGDRVQLSNAVTLIFFGAMFLVAAAALVAIWLVMHRNDERGERARIAPVVAPIGMLVIIAALLYSEIANGTALYGRGRVTAIVLVAGASAFALLMVRARRDGAMR